MLSIFNPPVIPPTPGPLPVYDDDSEDDDDDDSEDDDEQSDDEQNDDEDEDDDDDGVSVSNSTLWCIQYSTRRARLHFWTNIEFIFVLACYSLPVSDSLAYTTIMGQ